MTYKEFKSESERAIIRNGIQFKYTKLSEYHYILIISFRTLQHTNDYGVSYDWEDATTTLTSIQAYESYCNLLNGGLN